MGKNSLKVRTSSQNPSSDNRLNSILYAQAYFDGVWSDRYDPGSRRFLRLLRDHGWERIPAAASLRHSKTMGLEGNQRSSWQLRPGMGKLIPPFDLKNNFRTNFPHESSPMFNFFNYEKEEKWYLIDVFLFPFFRRTGIVKRSNLPATQPSSFRSLSFNGPIWSYVRRDVIPSSTKEWETGPSTLV